MRFCDIVNRADAQYALDVLKFRVNRQHNIAKRRIACGRCLDKGHAIHDWHIEIHKHKVDRIFRKKIKRLFSVGCLADNFHMMLFPGHQYLDTLSR